MATAPTLAPDRKPSAELRLVQESIRKILKRDQDAPEFAASVCDGLRNVETQVDRLAGLQELFEWYSERPAL
jgi:hypothetical protein